MGVYSESLNLYNNLIEPISPAKVFSDCVYDRLNAVFTVQADIFDECLDNLAEYVKRDMTKDYNLKRVDYLFKNLYHYSGINRIRLLDIMIDAHLNSQNYDNGGIAR
jgi:hypothetical protein